MAIASRYHELDELGGGRFRHTQYIKPIAYLSGGYWRGIVTDWGDGDDTGPHVVSASRLRVRTAPNGDRRILPVEGVDDAWFSISSPFVKIGGTWTQPSLGSFSRNGNLLSATTANVNTYIWHAGHYVKAGFLLKNGWLPTDNQFAFRVGLNGLTRSGGNLLYNGQTVATLRAPVAYDWDNPEDTRPIAHEFVKLSGKWHTLFTLPSLAGMSKPVVDPTLTDGYGGDVTTAKDCFMMSGLANHNTGIHASLSFGKRNHVTKLRRALLQFNVSSIPSTATCNSATLYLTLTSDDADTTSTLAVYRMVRAWVEGTKEYSDSGADGVTWNKYDGSNAWGTAGAANTSTDREAGNIGTRDMSASETLNSEISISLTAASVQDWWDGGLTNNGILLQNSENSYDGYTAASSDHATTGYRPKLVIEYTGGQSVVPVIMRQFRSRWG